jgi:hypothetical protein
MFFATAAVMMAAMFPALGVLPTPDQDQDRVNIPGTEINVCVVATVEDLVDIRADAQVLLEDAGVTFADLKALCDNASVSAPEVPEPPTSGGGDGGGNGGGSNQVDVVPSGAPETGDGSTEVPLTWVLGGLGALVTAGITAVALGARRTLPTRR